jgi:hypothetical protein
MKRVNSIAENTAKRVIDDFAIRTPEEIDVEAIAMAHRLFVTQGPLGGSWARLVRKGPGGLIRVSDTITIEGQKRFCIAHELGHFLLHSRQNQLEICNSTDMLPGYAQSREEQEANSFAAELLMPTEMFRSHLAPSELAVSIVGDLAGAFQTTMSATVNRIVDIAVHVCALVRSEAGKLKSFHVGPDFPFRLREMGVPLDSCSCAGEFFISGSTEKEAEVAAHAWLEDGRLLGNETIREITIPMPNYRSALTLLWVEPGSELDHRAAECDNEL